MASALAVFAKAPIPGHAKTRLAAGLGEMAAAEFYGRMLTGLLERLAEPRLQAERYLFAARDKDLAWFEGYRERWELRVQVAGDLGARLDSAFRRLFAVSCKRVVIVGADAPDLGPTDVQLAFDQLRRHDLVLGPAHDGGYYLIGLKSPLSELFKGIDWGTPAVLAQTLVAVSELRLRVGLLRPLPDIDTYQDWLVYQQALRHGQA